MDIKNKPTLAEKQAFQTEQLPNFESKYWLPSHFELLEFDMEGGNYEVRDVLPEHYSEDDATEIWHRVNTGWAMWKKAINFGRKQAQSVPESFEQAYSEIFSPIVKQPYPRLENGDYKYIEIDQGWKLWQAATVHAVPEWISVKDKLPGFNQSVLSCDGFETCVAEYLESCKNEYGVFLKKVFGLMVQQVFLKM